MKRYDVTPLENALKYQLNVTRGRGRGRSSNKGRGRRNASHSDTRNDAENEEKCENRVLLV